MKAITALVAGVPLLMSFLNAQEGGAKRPLVAFVGTFSSPLHNVRPTQVDLPPGNGRGIHLISRAPIGPIASPSPGPSTHAPSGPEAAPEAPYEEDSEFLRRRKRSWARLISKVWLDDPALCRSCQKPMKIIAAIAPEQQEVIERVLRHLHLWDPPWKRQRKVRGPPPPPFSRPATTSQEAPPSGKDLEVIDPLIDDELYAIDPVPPDDDGTPG